MLSTPDLLAVLDCQRPCPDPNRRCGGRGKQLAQPMLPHIGIRCLCLSALLLVRWPRRTLRLLFWFVPAARHASY